MTQLSIRNIALIDRLDVSFAPGLNVLTGETGAGKSIVVGSLDFALGGRADRDRIAEGAARGQVEAVFDVRGMARVEAALASMDIQAEDGFLTIGREIQQSGRSVSRVQGVSVPLAQLRQVTSLLVDLHGQHAHQSLLDPGEHLSFLDALGGAAHKESARGVRALFERWTAVKKALSAEETGALERARREDMLRFQLDELDGAALVEGEEDELDRQRTLLRNAEKIRDGMERAYAYLTGGEGDDMPCALDALRVALQALSQFARYADAYERLREQLQEAVYAVEGVAGDLDDLREQAETDPARLDGIETRLDQLSRLKRKYGATTRDMIAFRESVRAQLDESEHSDARRDALLKEEKKAREAVDAAADALSEARRTIARDCEARVLSHLAELGMQGARFAVSFAPGAALGPDGRDAVEFLLSANVGEPLRPLSKVASGGELSRIMLAFKCAEAENEGIPVLVFDEIDTGISGRMGQIVAEKMLAASKGRQVICVTHLPQIAAMADAQYLVEKREADGHTRTDVKALGFDARVEAIARMLGEGETAKAHARAMLTRR